MCSVSLEFLALMTDIPNDFGGKCSVFLSAEGTHTNFANLVSIKCHFLHFDFLGVLYKVEILARHLKLLNGVRLLAS